VSCVAPRLSESAPGRSDPPDSVDVCDHLDLQSLGLSRSRQRFLPSQSRWALGRAIGSHLLHSDLRCSATADHSRLAFPDSSTTSKELGVLRSPNHLSYFLVCVFELHIHAGMTPSENTKDFIRKPLTDLIYVLKIEHHRSKSVDV